MTTSRESKNFLRVLVSPENHNVDIVAVHGLNPTNTEFHAEATWTYGDKLWLKDFLPAQLPNARILLFGYNSNVAFETSISGVRENAVNLLNRLVNKRANTEERPIIFVAHSLGGIVVKRALVEAKLDHSYKCIRDATFGIAFFSTPHHGSNLGNLGYIAASIARAIFRNPKNTFMETLKKDSLFADEANDFRHQLENYHILSFYETLPTGKFGIIVDKKSATLGLPGDREKQIPLEADHSGVCKFASADGDDYEYVSSNLVRLVESAVESAAEREQKSVADMRTTYEQLLKRPRATESTSSNPKRARVDDNLDDARTGYDFDGHEDTYSAHSNYETDSDDNTDNSGELVSEDGTLRESEADRYERVSENVSLSESGADTDDTPSSESD
ncbi:hypothetical protein B0J14DRAFT_595495 [Halenospora varia]|nr:hypothetical protein B0J14DRAFT_595495 [Halenospora varia]